MKDTPFTAHRVLVSFLLAGLFFVYPNQLYSQVYDAELWKGIELEKGIGKKLVVSIKEQVRLDNNISRFKSTFINTGLSFRLSKGLGLSGGYRFTIRESKYDQRWFTDLGIKPKKLHPRLDLGIRLRYQQDYAIGSNIERAIRPKISLKYDQKKKKGKDKKKQIDFRPYISGEVFYEISYKGNEFNKYRLSSGFSYPLSKRNTVRLSYTYQQEFNTTNPKYSSIFAAAFTVELPAYKFPKREKVGFRPKVVR